MSIKAIHSILSNHAGYTTASSGGVYSYMAKDGISKPYTILFADQGEPITSQNNAAGKEWKDITVACFGITPEAAKAVADTARAVLDNYKGTAAGVQIEYCKYDGTQIEDYDRQLKKATIELRFRICYVLG